MELRFYPLDFDYRLKDGKIYVYLYGKTDSGQKICVRQEYQPYFYAWLQGVDEELLLQRLPKISVETTEGTAAITSWEKVERELVGKKEQFLKIFVNFPKAVPPLSRELETWGVRCHEKDILFIHRYLRDLGITPMTLLQATGEFVEEKKMRVPVFLASTISQVSKDVVEKVKILAVDIETYALRKEINFQKNPILMIGLSGVDEQGTEFRKVLTWRRFPHTLDYLEIVSDEVELLTRFREIVLNYQPDIITGYYSDGFDFPYLKARADKYGLPLDLGLDCSELLASSRSSQETEAKIRGILHLDVFKFIRNIFGKDLKTDSLSLDSVAGELLGHRKHEVNLDELAAVWDRNAQESSENLAPSENSQKMVDFCEYNLHDAHLTQQLCRKLLFDMIEFTKLVGLPLFDVIRMRFSRLVESYILKRAVEYAVIAPNKPGDEETEERRNESIQGAFVYEPTPGVYKDIIVFDFRSLYPTIITAHNIGPEGYHCSCCAQQPHVPGKEDYWFCQREKKFLPTVLEELILRRADLKRLIKEQKAQGNDVKMLEARSYALKTLANSFYGYLGFYGARWYSLESAASTTAYARNYIKTTIQRAEEKGFHVCYSDTDSCFILLGDKIIDQALEFMNEINFDLPGQMELEFQGYYSRGLFVAIKGSEKGAKKKYALVDKQGKIKITGFEMVRRNWSPLAKEVQGKVLSMVLSDQYEEALLYVKETVKELKKGSIITERLVIKTQITREMEQYSSIGPHVAVARKMQERGESITPGTVIEYVIVKGFGLVRERAKLPEDVQPGEYDSEYYLHHQLIPAVSGIFAVLGYKEEELLGESSQTGLGKFF